MADRFYCPELSPEGPVTLDPEESRHLARVRRIGIGEVVELFDGRGLGYRAKVSRLGKDRVELVLLEPVHEREPPREITLATAVPKGERFDWLVEKATELGVTRLVPLLTERSTVEPRPAKLERLRRVVVEASKQCGRNRLMDLEEPGDWTSFLDRCRKDAGIGRCLLAHPGGEPIDRVDIRSASPVVLAIGPEGGFTDAEIAAAGECGWGVVGLGGTVLRIETAGLAASAIMLARSTEA